MADPALLSRWPLPEVPEVAQAVLAGWREPNRRYHDVRHLQECLEAAVRLGGGRDELVALWFHDAVHTNTPGVDEAASAALLLSLLTGRLPEPQLAEATRLVLLTRHHRPEPDDLAGAVVCDADLWVLGAEPHRYAQSVSDLRTETGLEEAAWATTRRHQLTARLAGPIYHTPAGVRREARARANLTAELESLLRPGRS